VLLRRLTGRNGDPEVHRCGATRVAKALPREDVQQHRALACVRLPRADDVVLVAPRDDGGPLDELLRRGADVGPEATERADELRIARDEAAPEARHRRTLRQRVERDDVRPVVQLEDRGRRLVEPQLGVRLVRGEHEAVRAGKRGEPLEERERGDRPRRVVRRVQPDEGRPLPDVVGDLVEAREEAVLLEERKLDDTGAGERRPATRDRVSGLGDDHRVASTGGIDHNMGEREDRLLRTERRDHVPVGIDVRAEAPLEPGGDRCAKLREARRGRIAHPLANAVA